MKRGREPTRAVPVETLDGEAPSPLTTLPVWDPAVRAGGVSLCGPRVRMKDIVLVTLAVDTETGKIDPEAPFI
jgi:hypothetical protein